MKLSPGIFSLALCALFFAPAGKAQTSASGGSEAAQLEALTKKIEEQNAKIDTLSQQILKLDQQISTLRPGVMIGESTPAPAATSSVPVAAPAGPAPAGNAHVVAKGETLTSIAKTYKVGVQDLQ